MDRRTLLSRIAAGGAVAATTSVITSSPAFAAGGTCCNAASSYTLIGTCVPDTTITAGCRTTYTNTITVCRSLTTATMLLARTSAGLYRPYFDEIAFLSVTSPTSVVRSQNYIGWQADCRVAATLPDLTGYGSGNGSPCASPANGPTDISALFGAECGLFTVTIQLRNGFTPYGWSTCYIVPA